MLAAIILFVTFGACVAKDNVPLSLGKSIYVPNTNLLGSIPNGGRIFDSLPADCIRKEDIQESYKYDNYYRDTASFYSSIASTTNLRGSYEADFSMAATLDVTTKSISSSERKVSGDSLKMASKAYKQLVKKDCLHEGKLNPSLINAFNDLEVTISSPWRYESWRKYNIFLKRHGSHIVTEITYGSSIDQYSFSKSEKTYTRRDFTVKSCISLAGDVGVKKLNVSLCAGITDEEISRVTSLEMVSSLTVRGGKAATRGALVRKRSDKLIENFMNEGCSSPAAIQFKLKPIWEVLQEKFSSSKDLAKAINLEYYYKGYLNFDCPYLAKHKQVLQRFELSPNSKPDRPEYQCSLAPEGCHSNNDCHYRVGVYCGCYGDSCIRYGSKTLDTGKRRTTAAPYYGSGMRGKGCGWKVWGSRCACKNERTERKIIWSLDRKEALDAMAGGGKSKENKKESKKMKVSRKMLGRFVEQVNEGEEGVKDDGSTENFDFN